MKIKTARFGEIDVPKNKLIRMERPVLGFESLNEFCLVEIDELKPFLWLQSTEDSQIAFLVVSPVALFPDYRIEINPAEIAELKVENTSAVETYVIVTVPEKAEDMSVNLKGPVLINTENSKAKQLVLVNSNYKVKHSVMRALDNNAALSKERKTSQREELVPA